jgi:HAD superfamily hydrolase (TIGR01490 family)
MDPTFSDDKNKEAKYVAFFDLDRTLARAISGNTLVTLAWKKREIHIKDFMNAFYLYLLYKLRLRDPLNIIDEMVTWVKGKPETWIDELCKEACSDILLPSIFSEAVTEISLHKEKNGKVIILSSALHQICGRVSEFLGMDGFICSSLEVKDGYLTGKPAGRLCFGEEKKIRLMEYCRNNTMNPSESWYYGDSISDLSALENVGNPVCINPDRELKKEARKRGWRILVWKN